MPGERRQVSEIVSSKRFPFRTEGDVVRWSIWRGIRELERLEPYLPSVTAQVDAVMEVLRQEEFQQDFQKLFDRLSNVVSQHMGQGATGEARRTLAMVIAHVERMPSGYWQERYKKELRDKFGHMMDEGVGMSMRDMARDEG